MAEAIAGIFGAKPKGPSAAEQEALRQREEAAFKDRAEQDRLAALALNQRSRREALSFQDQRRKDRLGG